MMPPTRLDLIMYRIFTAALRTWCKLTGHDWNTEQEPYCTTCGEYQ